MKQLASWIILTAIVHNGLADVSLLNGNHHHHYHHHEDHGYLPPSPQIQRLPISDEHHLQHQHVVTTPSRDYLPPYRRSQVSDVANIKTEEHIHQDYNQNVPTQNVAPNVIQHQHHDHIPSVSYYDAKRVPQYSAHGNSFEAELRPKSVNHGSTVMSIVPSVEIAMDDIMNPKKEYQAPGYLPPAYQGSVDQQNHHHPNGLVQTQTNFEGTLQGNDDHHQDTVQSNLDHHHQVQTQTNYQAPVQGNHHHSNGQVQNQINYQAPIQSVEISMDDIMNPKKGYQAPGYLPPVHQGSVDQQNHHHPNGLVQTQTNFEGTIQGNVDHHHQVDTKSDYQTSVQGNLDHHHQVQTQTNYQAPVQGNHHHQHSNGQVQNQINYQSPIQGTVDQHHPNNGQVQTQFNYQAPGYLPPAQGNVDTHFYPTAGQVNGHEEPNYHAPGYLPPIDGGHHHHDHPEEQRVNTHGLLQSQEHVHHQSNYQASGYLPPVQSVQPPHSPQEEHAHQHATFEGPGQQAQVQQYHEHHHLEANVHNQGSLQAQEFRVQASNDHHHHEVPLHNQRSYRGPALFEAPEPIVQQNNQGSFQTQQSGVQSGPNQGLFHAEGYLPPTHSEEHIHQHDNQVDQNSFGLTQGQNGVPEPPVPNPVLSTQEQLEPDNIHGSAFDTIEDNSSGYNYEKKLGATFEDGAGVGAGLTTGVSTGLVSSVDAGPGQFDHHDPHPLPPSSSRIRTVQIVNNDQVRTLKVLESSDAKGMKTIKILGPSNNLPKDETNFNAVNIVGGVGGAVQTVKIFHDHEDVPLSGSYLPPIDQRRVVRNSNGYKYRVNGRY